MDVVSLSALPVGSVVWQPRQGVWVLSVVCKATFGLLPGRMPLLEEQEPLYEADRHWSDDPGWSLYAPADVAPVRRRADVVLVGEAYAPAGRPARSLIARLRVADIDKRVEVCADRLLGPDGAVVEGARFSRMPLLWERAAGGPDTANPVGVRADAKDAYGRRPLPNLVPPGLALMKLEDAIEPMGFGPVARAWPERRNKLGPAAASWSERDWPRQPLPPGMDVGYFNAAPWDQQVERLRDNERLVLEHLHPKHPHLATQLPGHHPRAFVARPGRAAQPVPLQVDLLWIRTDLGLCTVTWRGQVALDRADEEGRVVVALEQPGQTLSWEEITGGAAAIWEEEEEAPITQEPQTMGRPPHEATMQPQDGARFRSALSMAMAGQAPPQDTALPFAPSSPPTPKDAALPFGASTPQGTALPFAPSSPSVAASIRSEDPAQRLAGMPFAPAAAPASTPPPAPMPPPSVTPPPPALVPAPASVAPAPAPAAAAFTARPASVPPASVTPPPLVRPQMPRTIGEAAAGSPSPLHAGEAPGTSAGALSASNAAAAASAPWSLPRESPASGVAPIVAASAQPSTEARDVLQLLWLDPESPPRLRRQPAWQRILEDLEKRPLDKEHEDPTLAKEPSEIEDRREVFEILVRGSATHAEGMEAALAAAIRSDGKLIPPLRILAGDLIFPFDQAEALKATVAVVTPYLGNDEALRAAVTTAQEFLKVPDLRGVPAVAEGLMARVAEAWGQAKRPTPHGYLESTTERALLEGRCYQRRKLLGGQHLRALAQTTPAASASQLLPAYLPEALADQLPLYQRFRARAIVEVHPQIDQYETQPLCLRVLALARAANPPRRL